MKIIVIDKATEVKNMGSMPRGTGARYLECTTHDSEQGTDYVAMKWRRKVPAGIPPWHVLIDLQPDN